MKKYDNLKFKIKLNKRYSYFSLPKKTFTTQLIQPILIERSYKLIEELSVVKKTFQKPKILNHTTSCSRLQTLPLKSLVGDFSE